jgi:hypothetical protein
MVGLQTLTLPVKVRILVPQPMISMSYEALPRNPDNACEVSPSAPVPGKHWEQDKGMARTGTIVICSLA